MFHLSSRCQSAYLLAIGIGFSAAQAAPVTLYEGNVIVGSNFTGFVQDKGVTNLPNSYQVGSGNDMARSVTFSATGGSTHSSVTSMLLQGAAMSQIDYVLSLVGPAGPPVPVHVVASGFADGSGSRTQSSAFFTLNGTSLSDSLHASVFHNFADGRHDFMIDTVILFQPNADYSVRLLALASTGLATDNNLNFSEAFVDPLFIVDAAFASRYTVVGVPGQAPPSVPEPNSALLCMLGLVAFAGVTGRGRSGRTAP